MSATTISSRLVKEAAAAVGFHACGIAQAHSADHLAQRLDRWTDGGMHAEMHYMERYRDQRLDPRQMVPGAQSLICVLLSYNPSQLLPPAAPLVARYAYGEDYHQRIKRLLYQMIALISDTYPALDARPCCDTAPVAEKYWAAQAGLGWIGRNTLLVNPSYGSWCNIGVIITTAIADHYDSPIANRCADCHRCTDACPNHALSSQLHDTDTNTDSANAIPLLDARRCASYHTIESRQPLLPSDLRLSGYLFGCDICQRVCPYNSAAPQTLHVSDERLAQLQSLSSCDRPTFRHLARHSALARINYDQLLRNRNHTPE